MLHKMRLVLGILYVIFHASGALAQNSVSTSIAFTNGAFRATLVAPVLGADATITLPTSAGALLTTESGIVLGGNSQAITVGSTDASNVGIIANGNRIIHVVGEAMPGAAQGNVQIGTNVLSSATPLTSLVLDGALSLKRNGIDDVDALGGTITVGNRSFIVIENPTGGAIADAGNVTLSAGLTSGQIVFLTYQGPNSVTLTNFTAGSGVLNNRDVATLVWDGALWRPMFRKDNN